MRPAVAAVVAVLRAGQRHPTVAEFAALCREVGDDPAEARRDIAAYSAAIAEQSVPSGEASVLAALRSFSLRD